MSTLSIGAERTNLAAVTDENSNSNNNAISPSGASELAGRCNDSSNEVGGSNTQSKSNDDPQSDLPIEYQLYEVDLTNPDMDPLEYTFRRFVPIPRVYYWETSSESNHLHENLPFRIKMWHSTIYYLGNCLRKAEAAGEVVANILGLNSGPFDYVTDNMTEEEWARSRENIERRREEQRVVEEENIVKEDVGLSSREVL